MKTTKEITNEILQSLNQQDNPVNILLESYLKSVITDIVREQLIRFQTHLSDKELITDYDWGFEDEANDYLLDDPIK